MLYSKAKLVRQAHLEMLRDLAPNVSFTFNFGYLIRPIAAQTAMTRFMNAVQRKVYGRDWAKQFDRLWPVAMGFFEHPDSNPHYHVLARLEPELIDFVAEHGDAVWKATSARGQLDTKEVYGPDGIWSYVTKRLATENTFGDVWIYKDTRSQTVGESTLKVGKESGWL